MSATSQRSFAFLQSVNDLLQDHSEFDQVAYIKAALHGGLGTKSIFAEGVCAALCVYVISDWLNQGTRKKPVDQLVQDCNELNTVRPTLQPINDLSHIFDHGDEGARELAIKRIAELSNGKKPKSTKMEIKPGQAIESTKGLGPTFMAWGGLVKTGHAILCDASKRVIFDPNVGYYQATDNGDYLKVFGKLVALYPEYSKVAAVTLYSY